MDEIREVIDKTLGIRGRPRLYPQEWEKIKTAIDEAHPNNETVSAALSDLDKARPDDRWHHITLYGDQSGNVFSHGPDEQRRRKTLHFSSREEIAPTICSLIPKPEPTPEEDLEAIRLAMPGLTQVTDIAVAGRAALDRVRKRLDEIDWCGP